MSAIQSSLSAVNEAVTAGHLLKSSRDNILALLEGTTSPIAAQAINELVENKAWEELNDRFYKTSLLVPAGSEAGLLAAL